MNIKHNHHCYNNAHTHIWNNSLINMENNLHEYFSLNSIIACENIDLQYNLKFSATLMYINEKSQEWKNILTACTDII